MSCDCVSFWKPLVNQESWVVNKPLHIHGRKRKKFNNKLEETRKPVLGWNKGGTICCALLSKKYNKKHFAAIGSVTADPRMILCPRISSHIISGNWCPRMTTLKSQDYLACHYGICHSGCVLEWCGSSLMLSLDACMLPLALKKQNPLLCHKNTVFLVLTMWRVDVPGQHTYEPVIPGWHPPN